MKKIQALLVSLCLLALMGTVANPNAASPASEDLGARIKRVQNGLIRDPGFVVKGQPPDTATIWERMKQYRVPGVSIAVINEYEIEWEEGYGVKESGGTDPVTPDTLFQAASISKPVSAATALYYVEKGILGLDQDVNPRLRSWKVPENQWTRKEKVTLRGLLSHTAGMTVSGFPGYAEGKELPSLVEILKGTKPANTAPIRVDIEIGSRFRYSGGGYTIMQQLLVDILSRPFSQIVQGVVLLKLDMSRSTFEQPLPPAWASEASSGHRANGSAVPGNWHTYPEMAAAGLWTTPYDLALFAREIMLAKQGKSDRVLSHVMVEMMLTPVKEGYGLGFIAKGSGRDFQFSHSGGNEGFRCNLIAYPERGQGAVIMTNGDLGGALLPEILRSLSVEYGWPDFQPTEKEVYGLENQQLELFAGTYRFTPADRIKVSPGNGCLFIEPVFIPPDEKGQGVFFAESETSFFSTETEVRIGFTKDAQGQVTGLTLIQGKTERKAVRVN
ncbi:MAG: serine hydrolase [Candidatus Aminicenantales bacterium]